MECGGVWNWVLTGGGFLAKHLNIQWEPKRPENPGLLVTPEETRCEPGDSPSGVSFGKLIQIYQMNMIRDLNT